MYLELELELELELVKQVVTGACYGRSVRGFCEEQANVFRALTQRPEMGLWAFLSFNLQPSSYRALAL